MVKITWTEEGGYTCQCQRSWLRLVQYNDGSTRLSSHLPPGETDPHNFCKHSHDIVDDGKPFCFKYGGRGILFTPKDLDAFQVGGRQDEDVIPVEEYKIGRVPMGVLGVEYGNRRGKVSA